MLQPLAAMMRLEVCQTVLHPTDNMLIYPQATQDINMSPSMSYHDTLVGRSAQRTLGDLGRDIRRLFSNSLTIPRMLSMSLQMRKQYWRQLQEGTDCMLPSYSHRLPTGQEKGTYLALDVGGSTLRLALVDLNGRYEKDAARIRRMTVAPIDQVLRKMPSEQFFDWIAERIEAMLKEEPNVQVNGKSAWPLGIAWSFPIDQTSPRSGKVRGMGKGFSCHQDTIGQDLGDLIVNACRRRSVSVRVDAIVNDSSATLLSQAYLEHSTSMGLIVGTGTNAAVHLPTSCIAQKKFGQRDSRWHARAEKVITNTELSMFGKGVLPHTRWDTFLNSTHVLPDFQPLEYMTTGRYLGEILRLIIIEAVEVCSLFGGLLPHSLQEPYSLDTITLAKLEEDVSPSLTKSTAMLQKAFQLPFAPTIVEVQFLRLAAEAISHRASALLAVAIHALWALQKETEIHPTSPCGTPKTSIACNGSVILKYPGFRDRAEDLIAQMIRSGSKANDTFGVEEVKLQPTDEAAILGAAVAVALSAGDED